MRIERAHEAAWGRPAQADEVERALKYLSDCKQTLAAAQISRGETERFAWLSLAKVMLASNEFLYVN
jgi:hypothetical protein